MLQYKIKILLHDACEEVIFNLPTGLHGHPAVP